jgi:hypothetical protein
LQYRNESDYTGIEKGDAMTTTTQTARLYRSPSKPHCELCGAIVDPFHCDDGYTPCCSELVCENGDCVVVVDNRGGWTETIHFYTRAEADDYIEETP